jgi:hypothetical protein
LEDNVPVHEGHAVEPPDSAELRAAVERALSDRLGADIAVASLTRRRSEHSSSYPTEIVTAHFADREPLRLFLKDYAAAAWQKDLMPERRLREVTVYRDLLKGAGLGTPDYLGAVWDEDRERRWLLLEHVDGPQVKWCRFEEWQRAAAWLGRLHGRFSGAQEQLEGVALLVRHDAAFFLDTAEQATTAVSSSAPHMSRPLAAALSGYREHAEEMAVLPRTLTHGGYRPQNIIRGVQDGRARICPADWEEAALGSRFYDFAYLADGFEQRQLARLWTAYREQASREGVELPPDVTARRLVCAFNVHKNLGTLAKAVDREFPVHAVEKLVGMVEASAEGARA